MAARRTTRKTKPAVKRRGKGRALDSRIDELKLKLAQLEKRKELRLLQGQIKQQQQELKL
jgi:hypothetical protein